LAGTNMKKRLSLVLGCLVLAAFTRIAGAQVQVGDKPDLEFKSSDGQRVSLAALQGKLVLVDFWASWCGPCMAEAAHMVRVNKAYSDKGLVMLGISLDDDPSAMNAAVKAKHFDWPQYDDENMGSKISKAWGVFSIPHSFLVGPDGTVLWEGHPASGMDEAITKAMKEHPPLAVDPGTAADAAHVLDQVEAALKSDDPTGALKAMAKFPAAAAKEPTLASRYQKDQKSLSAAADAMMRDVDGMLAQKQYADCAIKLKQLIVSLNGTPVGAKAQQKLSAMMADPSIKGEIDAADKAEKAANALAMAQKLKAEKKDSLAYTRFKAIVTQFPGTPSAETAAAEVSNYEKDPTFVQKVSSSSAAVKAKAALNLADSYKTAGRTEMARKKYQEIIAQFPGTEWADSAQKSLTELSQN